MLKEQLKQIAKNKFIYRQNGNLMEVEVKDDGVHIEDGPEDQVARWHQSIGGIISLEKFMTGELKWQKDYKGVHQALRDLIIESGLYVQK